MNPHSAADLDGLAATVAALRTPPPHHLTADQARDLLRRAAENLAGRGAAEAAAHVLTTAEALPAAPLGGWTTDRLADLLDPEPITTPQDYAEGAATVVALADERTRRAATRPEADIDDDGEDGATVDGQVIYHPAAGAAPWEASAPNRPVLPLWLRDGKTARAAARWAAGHLAHVCAFHTVRLPVYWARLAARAPHGVWRTAKAVGRWTFDAEALTVRRALAAAADRTSYDLADANTFVRLEEQRRSLVRYRSTLTGVGVAVVLLVAFVAALVLPWWVLAAGVVVAAVAFGLIGRDVAEPVLSRSVDTQSTPRLTSELILTALGSLGIGELNKHLRASGTEGVLFPTPITREGAGWRADIDLPPGVTAGDVAERRDRLASGLRRPVGCVWPEGDGDAHAGRLVLWVGDRPMSKTKPTPWPLLRKGRVNVFEPFAFGTDPRGNTVTITLMFAAGLIGAIPRVGKTFAARLIALAAALDPRCELHLFDFKGGADWLPLEPVAHAFRVGDEPEDHAYVLADARALRADMSRRYKTLRSLTRQQCPEGKVTDELASDPRLGLHPVLWLADECQQAYAHPDHGAEYAEIITDLAKRGPAVGIMVWNATQRPTSDSVPPALAAVAVLRYCLKVNGQLENDVVLGTSAYKNGTRATMFTRKDKGIGYLVGEGEDPQIVRGAFVDGSDAENVVARARAARLAAGRLTGHAAGIDPTAEAETPETVIDHLIAVWPTGQPRVWCETLAERLAGTYPALYGTWRAEDVTAAVKPHGLTTRQIKRDGANRRGLDLADVLRTNGHTDDTERPEAG